MIRYACFIRLLVLIGHLYVSGIWSGVAPKMEKHVQKYIGLHAPNMITILGPLVNIIEGTYITI
jgi:hypothetical protein